MKRATIELVMPEDRLATPAELMEACVLVIEALRAVSHSPADALAIALGSAVGLARMAGMPIADLREMADRTLGEMGK